jgi:hypothetical protein
MVVTSSLTNREGSTMKSEEEVDLRKKKMDMKILKTSVSPGIEGLSVSSSIAAQVAQCTSWFR